MHTRSNCFAAEYNYYDNGNVKDAQYHNPQVQTGGGPATHQWAFAYDGLNRLLDANFEGSSAKFDVSGLSYDAAGNITGLRRRKENGTWIDDLAYTYQSGTNKLSSLADAVSATTESWDAESASFGYDPNGNLTSQSGKFTSITYDHRNLPTHFALDGGTDVRAFYNGDGQRVLKEQDANNYSFYVMDGPQTLAVIKDGTLSHMNLVGNAIFGRLDADGSGNISTTGDRKYYLADHLGSTRAVANDSGTILETFDYYPFGLLMPKRSSTTGNTIEKFTGKERDEAIGLDYFGARYYDPAVSRFTSVDPLADNYPAWSPYNYTLGNPVNLIDPDGMAVEEIAGGVRYTGIDAQNFFRQLKSQYGGQSGSCPDPPCGGDEDKSGGEQGNNNEAESETETMSATTGVLAAFMVDLTAPEPTDVVPYKWAGWLIIGGGTIVLDQLGFLDTTVSLSNAQDKKLTNGEIKKLQDAGIDVHKEKGGKSTGGIDLYKKPNGDIVIKPKGGKGPGEPTGLNINNF